MAKSKTPSSKPVVIKAREEENTFRNMTEHSSHTRAGRYDPYMRGATCPTCPTCHRKIASSACVLRCPRLSTEGRGRESLTLFLLSRGPLLSSTCTSPLRYSNTDMYADSRKETAALLAVVAATDRRPLHLIVARVLTQQHL